MALDAHPDRRGDDATDASMAAINEAWWVLSDPARRAEYDQTLAAVPDPTPPRPSADPPRHATAARVDEPVDPDEPRWVDHTADLRRFRMLMTTVVIFIGLLFILVFAFIIWPETS